MVSASFPVFCSPTKSMRRGERWYFLATLCTQVGSVALNSSVWRSGGTWGGEEEGVGRRADKCYELYGVQCVPGVADSRW
jgi:hypothetical protein